MNIFSRVQQETGNFRLAICSFDNVVNAISVFTLNHPYKHRSLIGDFGLLEVLEYFVRCLEAVND